MAEHPGEGPKEAQTVVHSETVSAPGARVKETHFTLSDEAQSQLQIHAKLPAAAGPR
jgi:hypothetical protein